MSNDLYDQAVAVEPSKFFGLLHIEIEKVVLVTGLGKVPFNEVQHAGMKSHISISFMIVPTDPTKKEIKRSVLSWTKEFKNAIKPSIDKLQERLVNLGKNTGNPLRDINDMWVCGEFVARPDNKPGEDWTTLSFLDVFASEELCRAAYEEHKNSSQTQAAASDTQPQQAQKQTSIEQQLAIAKMLWDASSHSVDIFRGFFDANKPSLPGLEFDSAEIQGLINPGQTVAGQPKTEETEQSPAPEVPAQEESNV